MSKYEWLRNRIEDWYRSDCSIRTLSETIAAELDRRYPDPEPEIVDGWPVWKTHITVRQMYGNSAQLQAVGSIVQSLDGKRFRVTSEFRPPKENDALLSLGDLCADIALFDYHHRQPRIILEPVKTRKVKVPRVVLRLPGRSYGSGDWLARVRPDGYADEIIQARKAGYLSNSEYHKVEVTFDEVEVSDK